MKIVIDEARTSEWRKPPTAFVRIPDMDFLSTDTCFNFQIYQVGGLH